MRINYDNITVIYRQITLAQPENTEYRERVD